MSRLLAAFALMFTFSANAASVCSNLILETREGAPILKKYELELKKAIYGQMKKLGWRGHGYISVQNMPNTLYRIHPQYMIRIDVKSTNPKSPKTVLRNKTIQTALKIESYPLPETNSCELVLQARESEYLVIQNRVDQPTTNVGDVPTKIYVPILTVRQTIKIVPSEKEKARAD